jgi:hypothetical protein
LFFEWNRDERDEGGVSGERPRTERFLGKVRKCNGDIDRSKYIALIGISW